MTDDWKDGPWDRRYGEDVQLKYIKESDLYDDEDKRLFECGFRVQGRRVEGNVRIEPDGEWVIYGGGVERLSGQMQNWIKGLTVFFVITSFKDLRREVVGTDDQH